MGSGGKFAAEIKFFDLSTSIVTIATILFFLTALVISTYNVIEGWLASRSFLHVQSKAESGDVEAKNNLGLMYVMGQGVEQDFKVAMDLFNKAADQGEVNAQNNLGMMHADGQGVEQNYVTAYAWASIAEVNGGEAAKQNKSILAKEMNHKQITEAEEFVKEMIRKNPKLIKNKKIK